jgi:hypothetical protein
MTRYRRSTEVTWELADERAVILDAAGSTLTTLNPLGTVIWRHLDEPRRASELSDALAGRFPSVNRRQLDADTEEFIVTLVGEGLVVTSNEG